MSDTTPSAERLVREFANTFPTPNVQRAVALCEDGTLTWEQVAGLFDVSLREAMEQVQ